MQNSKIVIDSVEYDATNLEELFEALNPSNINSIRMVTHTKNPLETLYLMWKASKHANYLTIEEIIDAVANDPKLKKNYDSTIRSILQSIIPIARTIWFTFECKDTPLAWREQLVRSCLSGDTRIKLFNGQSRTIKELTEEYDGKPFLVYSCDKNGTIVPGHAHSPAITGRRSDMVVVKFDNGQSVRCTSDHKFLTINGVYVEASELSNGTSVMAMYEEINQENNPKTCNHSSRVIEVIKLNNVEEDVYDITVDEFHNFALDFGDGSGVFVHNSIGVSFWAQSSRITDLTDFQYYLPPAIATQGGPEAVDVFRKTMEHVRAGYQRLRELGCYEEDSKMVMPEGRLQTIFFSVNFEALAGITRKRRCWFAQSSMWSPILIKMLQEISKVSPVLSDGLGKPPCLLASRSCPFSAEANTRMYGKDPLPACPLYALYTGKMQDFYKFIYPHQLTALEQMVNLYRKTWPNEYVRTMDKVVGQPFTNEELGSLREIRED